ncbi:hypothetical protein WMY93_022896 [Mugilogobius chulae]|uniref:Transposase n=1 Tax=Mugilogobius chulae TaxID=88201 RepID=A0AAW0NDA1_9GOBI
MELRHQRLDCAATNKLFWAIAKWVATDCRPIAIVEDHGLREILRIASRDPSYELPCRTTTASKIHSLYEEEKARVSEALEQERHFADVCAEHFMHVARQWNLDGKISSLTTDSARNMIAAARQLPFDHMPCIAHSIHRAITVTLHNSTFDGTLAK